MAVNKFAQINQRVLLVVLGDILLQALLILCVRMLTVTPVTFLSSCTSVLSSIVHIVVDQENGLLGLAGEVINKAISI